MRFLLFLCPVLLAGQTAPANLGFRSGTPGAPPPGWTVPQIFQTMGYSAEFRQQGCRTAVGCAVLLAPAVQPAGAFGKLMQTFDAAPFRGQTVRLQAWIQIPAATPSDHAQLWFQVDLPNQPAGTSYTIVEGPVTSATWKHVELTGEVTLNGVTLSVGVSSWGKSPVWIDGLSFDTVPAVTSGPQVSAARGAIERLYSRIDSAYEQSDLDAIAALALPDAQIGLPTGKIPLSDALLQIMAGLDKGEKYSSLSTVTDFRLVGNEAVVSVNNESARIVRGGRQALISSNRDTWVRSGSAWKLKESTLVSSHLPAPVIDPETAVRVVADLKQRATPLRTTEPGGDLDDLAAFGKAVGDARIVALGEASRGTREFFQMKHRLLEYLVRKKGFTVFALEANWPESLAVDRYIKTGEGDPRKAIAGMYLWSWNTEEVLDLIEWMRRYNQAPGNHPTLTFTSFDMQTGHVAAQKVLEYLGRTSPDDVQAAAEAYTEAQILEGRRTQVYDDKAKSAADHAASVIKIFDAKGATLIAASSPEAWRDARQAATIVFQSCSMRIPGKGPSYREESMAGNVAWLAGQVHPNERIVLWAGNEHVRFDAVSVNGKSMGASLRERFGKQMYVVGFSFRRGRLRGIGMENGSFTGLSVYNVPESPEGTGDEVLSAAGMPLFFLDMTSLPQASPLAGWLAAPHLYHSVGANWVIDDPASNMEMSAPARQYDGLIFVEESHAARGLEK